MSPRPTKITMNKKERSWFQWQFNHSRHHQRRKAFLAKMPHKLTCQLCGGAGGAIEEIVTDWGAGQFLDCGLCEGEGILTPYERMDYLRMMKQAKREKAKELERVA